MMLFLLNQSDAILFGMMNVALVKAIGGNVTQGDGSRVRFELNDISLNIHSPHPQKELKRYQVKAIREFLMNAGVDL